MKVDDLRLFLAPLRGDAKVQVYSDYGEWKDMYDTEIRVIEVHHPDPTVKKKEK